MERMRIERTPIRVLGTSFLRGFSKQNEVKRQEDFKVLPAPHLRSREDSVWKFTAWCEFFGKTVLLSRKIITLFNTPSDRFSKPLVYWLTTPISKSLFVFSFSPKTLNNKSFPFNQCHQPDPRTQILITLTIASRFVCTPSDCNWSDRGKRNQFAGVHLSHAK